MGHISHYHSHKNCQEIYCLNQLTTNPELLNISLVQYINNAAITLKQNKVSQKTTNYHSNEVYYFVLSHGCLTK